MPNTTSDLDRDAFKKAMEAFFAEDPYERYPDTHACVKAAIKAYLAALPPASGSEPVAWRHRIRTVAEHLWSDWRQGKGAGCYHPVVMVDEQPLYATPTPPSASSGDGELSKGEQIAAIEATGATRMVCAGYRIVENLHEDGFRIVRTAPSGEQK